MCFKFTFIGKDTINIIIKRKLDNYLHYNLNLIKGVVENDIISSNLLDCLDLFDADGNSLSLPKLYENTEFEYLINSDLEFTIHFFDEFDAASYDEVVDGYIKILENYL